MESVVKDICEGLVDTGEEVEVLCSNVNPMNHNCEVKGVKVTKVFRLGTLFSQSLTPSLLYRIFFKGKKADLVHLHCPNPLAELACLFLPKDIPLVITWHSDIIRQKSLLRIYKPLQRKILERAQKIIVPTQNHIEYSPVLPEFSHKCEIVPFGMRTEGIPSEDKLEKRSKDLKEKYGKFALFVGRLVGYKGLNILIDAAKKVSSKVLIVGQGPENEKLREQVKKLGLEEKVKILGRIEDLDEFWGYYRACEFFVLPSVTANENFGIVQLEAMYHSKAVITTNLRSGVPAVGEKGKTTLLVSPGNSDQLATAMESLFNNPEKALEMGLAGKKRFQDLYTHQQMIHSHLRIYRNLLSRDLRKADKENDLANVS